jgi:hypothetical protein
MIVLSSSQYNILKLNQLDITNSNNYNSTSFYTYLPDIDLQPFSNPSSNLLAGDLSFAG